MLTPNPIYRPSILDIERIIETFDTYQFDDLCEDVLEIKKR